MEYSEQILNHTERPLLPAMDADKEIARLQSIIKAQAGTIAELQGVIRDLSRELRRF